MDKSFTDTLKFKSISKNKIKLKNNQKFKIKVIINYNNRSFFMAI